MASASTAHFAATRKRTTAATVTTVEKNGFQISASGQGTHLARNASTSFRRRWRHGAGPIRRLPVGSIQQRPALRRDQQRRPSNRQRIGQHRGQKRDFRRRGQYQCYAGFGLVSGQAIETIHCTGDGHCSAWQCTPLPGVPHANATALIGGGMNYGSVIRFECEPGYVRTGAPVLPEQRHLVSAASSGPSASLPARFRTACSTLPTSDAITRRGNGG